LLSLYFTLSLELLDHIEMSALNPLSVFDQNRAQIRAQLSNVAFHLRGGIDYGRSIENGVTLQPGRERLCLGIGRATVARSAVECHDDGQHESAAPHVQCVRDAAIILLMFRHGLWTAELVALRWQQIDLKAEDFDVHRVKQGHNTKHPLRVHNSGCCGNSSAPIPTPRMCSSPSARRPCASFSALPAVYMFIGFPPLWIPLPNSLSPHSCVQVSLDKSGT
jgi:hypothetical protein